MSARIFSGEAESKRELVNLKWREKIAANSIVRVYLSVREGERGSVKLKILQLKLRYNSWANISISFWM